MAGTVTITRQDIPGLSRAKIGEIVTLTCVGDSSNGSFPATTIPGLQGFIVKVITKPGATNPTANYDIALYSPLASTLDSLGGALADRSASTAEQKAPVLSGATCPVFVSGDYSFAITNNSVASAQITVYMFILNQ